MMNRVSIIMYHYVRDLKQGRFRDIKGLDIDLFNGQIQYLVKNYNVITMDELINSIDNNDPLPPKAVLLSFDDGYNDHIDNVFPVLSKHKIQGSFYPSAKIVLNNEVLDVNKIHFILASVGDKFILINEIFKKVDEYRQAYGLDKNETYFSTYAIAGRYDTKEVIFIKRMLQVVLAEKLRNIICNYLFSKYVTADEHAFSKELYMNVDKIKYLLSEGMHIGSHGHDHYWLGSLSKEKQEYEIDRSIEFLQLIGCDMKRWTMCYPYGNYNDDTLEILKNKACKLALTTKINVAGINEDHKYTLPRLDTNDIPTAENAATNKWFVEA